MGLEITRDHRRKMGEAGSSTGPVMQLCGSPRDLKPGFGALGVGEQRVGELGESENSESRRTQRGAGIQDRGLEPRAKTDKMGET